MTDKYEKLISYLASLGSAAVAFSGGVDSAFLLAAAHEALGGSAAAICAEGAVFPESERLEAVRFCAERGIRRIAVNADLLSLEAFRTNPPDRCYYCKRELLGLITSAARENGFACVLEGTNADEVLGHRPGMRAVRELGVISPLLESGFTKAEIRALSKELGLSGWDRPSAACLASRIAYGESVTDEKLRAVEKAEAFLRSVGFGVLRVRMHGETARIEVAPGDILRAAELRSRISEELHALGFRFVTVDLDGFRSGSMNKPIDNSAHR